MTTPGKNLKPRPSSPSNKRLIEGNLRDEGAFREYLEKMGATFDNRVRKKKILAVLGNNMIKNNKKNNKKKKKTKSTARKILQFLPGGPRYHENKKGGGEFDMELDEQTGSSMGNMQNSLTSQNSRNQLGGASFIPAPGVPGTEVGKMSFLANNSVQNKANMVFDNNVHKNEKPCPRGGGKKKTKKKRKRKRKKKTRRKRRTTRKRKAGRSRRRRTKKNKMKLRFSKMPPLYL